eukprot:jgi/Botrbrau1/14156/Bobra.182_3s0096.1
MSTFAHARLCSPVVFQARDVAPPKFVRDSIGCRVRCCIEDGPNNVQSPLRCAQQNAKFRASHTAQPRPMCLDTLAMGLLGDDRMQNSPHAAYKRHILSTAFLDQQLLQLADMMNVDLQQGYQQIVFVGPGLDTRPFRLVWPQGTSMFEIAPKESHLYGTARMKEMGVRVVPRCGFWRVPCELQEGQPMTDALQCAGYNSSKLSLWCLQGLVEMGLSPPDFTRILGEISTVTAFGSLVFGHLPALTQQGALDLLADVGLYGTTVSFGELAANWTEDQEPCSEPALLPDQEQEWLFVAKQQNRSDAQWETYHMHVEAADGADEDDHLFFS